MSVKERIHRLKTGSIQATRANKENIVKILEMIDDRLTKIERPKDKPKTDTVKK